MDNKLITYICVLAKKYLHSNKYYGRGLNLEVFMSILNRKYESDFF